jgi:pyruvate dehydrogenase phosphatase
MVFPWHQGHAGCETADYAAYMLPGLIRQRIAAILERDNTPSPSLISNALTQAIVEFDRSIGDALLQIFPDKLALMDLNDDDVKGIINDNGPTSSVVLRCMRGSTVLISITDPSGSNLWVASLGDSAASEYGIETTLLVLMTTVVLFS